MLTQEDKGTKDMTCPLNIIYNCDQKFMNTHHGYECHDYFGLLMISFNCSFSRLKWFYSIHLL